MKSAFKIGILWGLCVQLTWAQVDFGVGVENDLAWMHRANPAWSTIDTGFALNLFDLSYAGWHSGGSFDQVFARTDDGLLLDPQGLNQSALAANHLITTLDVQSIALGWRKDSWAFGLSHRLRLQTDLSYPGALLDLYLQGNQPFIGELVEIGPAGEFLSYIDFGFQIQKDVGALRIAMRPRLLFGQQFLATRRNQLSLFTDPEFYALTFNTDFEIHSVGLLDFERSNFLDFTFRGISEWDVSTPHVGFALDLGLSWQKDDWSVGLGLSDLGSLSWKEADVYLSEETLVYDGVEIPDILNLDEVILGANLDSLRAFFDFSERTDDVTSTLRSQLHFSLSRTLNTAWTVGLQLNWRDQDVHPLSAGVAITYHRPKFRVGLVPSYRFGQANLGLYASGLIGRIIRPYVSIGNVLDGLSPLASTNYGLRMGVRFDFRKR